MINVCTCIFVGVWHSKQAKDADVCTVDVDPKHKLVAMGNSRGYISLFRHPCSKQGVSTVIFHNESRYKRVCL